MKIDIGNFKEYPKRRKIKVKIHDSDVYDFRSTMSIVIVAALKKFRKQKRLGTPLFCFPEGSAYDFSDEDAKIGEDNWKSILDKMIFAFEELATGEKELIILNKDKYEVDEILELEEKIQEGLNLFAKHYKALWI